MRSMSIVEARRRVEAIRDEETRSAGSFAHHKIRELVAAGLVGLTNVQYQSLTPAGGYYAAKIDAHQALTAIALTTIFAELDRLAQLARDVAKLEPARFLPIGEIDDVWRCLDTAREIVADLEMNS